MSQANPLISAIMATYNRERYIRAALESILQQPYSPMEIIVVDDGSTDDTPAVIRRLIDETAAPIQVVRQLNRGAPAAQNAGLRLARGQVLTFPDSDDLWPPDRLPAQLAMLADDGPSAADAIGIVLGRKQHFADGVAVNPAELAAANARPVHFSLASSLIARWVFDRIGCFDETLLHVADWDWFVRAREAATPMVRDPRVTVLGRIHGGNLTQDRAVGAHFTAHMVKKHLERTRKTGACPDPGTASS